ncbi:hypothetical protein [Streptomyces sp. NPDC019890]|uniref:hypothetical protein n=1 Tax=Streptomyces sp. NPDC019890 TaxID=3365064 RepID=UPI00384FBE1A
MPEPTLDDGLTPEHIRQAAHTLAQLTAYLRTGPSLPEVLPLLTPLVDEDDGVPVRLADALRAVSRLLAQGAHVPWSDEVRGLISEYLEAATILQELHVLHWTLRHLERTPNRAPGTPCP